MSGSTENAFGRLKILGKLGSGSQATVYLAEDPVLERKVAVKLMTATGSELASIDEDGRPLEGRISGKLKHPNIVAIYDAGDSPGGPYLVFEFVEGDTLADILKFKGPFSIRDAVAIISPTLDALATAHRSRVVHLDLSPRNILIDNEGVPRVMDFGLSQFMHQIPEQGEYLTGTLRYMSPEHFTRQEIGAHTDVFALGSSFMEMVTGQQVMDGTSMSDVQRKIMAADVDFTRLDDLPLGFAFEKFLRGALSKNIEDRYANCGEMQDAFRTFIRDAELEDALTDDTAQHSTIEYLLRRMRKKKDFPTISRTLADINRLTSDGSNASADVVANVILRDFALTSKLLKLVNSSFYGLRAGEMASISQAVAFLGLEQVRMTANSLTFFGQLKGDAKDTELKDAMTKSFLSGLIARHLAQRKKLPEAEEAFICGMFQSLGENLVIYYFRDEYDEIRELMKSDSLDKQSASRSVLGVRFSALGAAVASTWQLPDTLLDSIRGIPGGPVPVPDSQDKRLRDIAVFANEFCDLALKHDAESRDAALDVLLERFAASVELESKFCTKLLNAGFEKLQQYSPLFEINVETSGYCRSVRNWLDCSIDIQNDEIADARPRISAKGA